MTKFRINRPDDETIEFYVILDNNKTEVHLETANHDEHGHAGMGLAERLVTGIADFLEVPVIEGPVEIDVDSLTGPQIDDVIERVLGPNEEDEGEYYSDYTGANAFWHLLAGTQSVADPNVGFSSGQLTLPYGVSKSGDKVTVDGVGVFTLISDESKYDEQGDLDHEMIYQVGNRYFRKTAELDSWDGGLWSGRSREVKQKEKTITVWE